jgi:membrane protein DedA with SNARE-associated domain
LRWQHMYSHEVLHFLSGVVGSFVGCWIYFAIQRKRDDSK